MRIRTAHFPRVKTLEDFNLDHLPSLRRDVLAHLATGTFVAKAENVLLLGPPGIGKTPLAIGLAIKTAHAGYSVLFDTASNWISRLTTAHQAGRLDAELKKIRRYKLIVVDEVGLHPLRSGRGQPVLPAHRLTLWNKPRSWSPRTCRSAAGARPSPTTSAPLR